MIYKNVRSTLALALILAVSMPLFGMNHLRHRFATKVTKQTLYDSIEAIPKPTRLFKKSWQQRIMICASLLVQCLNNCCGHDVDHDENGNSDYLDYVRQKPAAVNIPTVQVPASLPLSASTSTSTSGIADAYAAQVPVSKSVSVSAMPAVPGTDDEFILNHYQEPRWRLESALANAPIKAMDLLDMLKYPSLYSHKVRFAVLYGPPGIAKSTLAKAITWKAGWFLELIVGRQVRAEHRGGASIKLQSRFAEIIASKRDTVIVIDEINRFFENYNSTKYDTGDTAEDFWTFLDEQKRNTHLYIIGTANQIDKLPPQIRSRARNRFIKINPAGGIEGTILRFKQVFDEHVLSPACDQAFLTQFLTPLHENGWRIRDFESLLESAEAIARRTDKLSPRLAITPAQLQEALKDIQEADTDSNYGTEAESEEERHHKENLAQQKELHKETTKIQREQFVKGQMIQKDMHANQVGASGNIGGSIGTGGINLSGSLSSSINNISWSDECITNNLSDEEMCYYREQKQIMLQRTGPGRIKILFKDLKKRIEFYKQRLSAINSPRSQSLIAKIDHINGNRKGLSDYFQGISRPSQRELNNFTQSLIQLNRVLGELQPQIEALVAPASNSGDNGKRN